MRNEMQGFGKSGPIGLTQADHKPLLKTCKPNVCGEEALCQGEQTPSVGHPSPVAGVTGVGPRVVC